MTFHSYYQSNSEDSSTFYVVVFITKSVFVLISTKNVQLHNCSDLFSLVIDSECLSSSAGGAVNSYLANKSLLLPQAPAVVLKSSPSFGGKGLNVL